MLGWREGYARCVVVVHHHRPATTTTTTIQPTLLPKHHRTPCQQLSAVSAAGPSRAAVASVYLPGAGRPSLHDGRHGFGPHDNGGEGGDGWGNEDKSLSAAAKAGLAVGLLAALTVLGVLGVHVWRQTSPARFWELEAAGRSSEEREEDMGGEHLERPSAAAGDDDDDGGSWWPRGGRRGAGSVRGSMSAPQLEGEGGGRGYGGEEGDGDYDDDARRGGAGEGEEMEIPIDGDGQGHARGRGTAQQQQEQGAMMRRARSASLPSRVAFGGGSAQDGRGSRSGSEEGNTSRSGSGSDDGGNSDPESGGRTGSGVFFEMV